MRNELEDRAGHRGARATTIGVAAGAVALGAALGGAVSEPPPHEQHMSPALKSSSS